MTAELMKNPIRADHVGSLLRPQVLIDAMARKLEGKIPEAELAPIQDSAIDEVVRMQEELGLRFATDGEYRRTSYMGTFLSEGMGIPRVQRVGEVSMPINERIRWTKPVHVRDFSYLKAHTKLIPKITLLGPCRVHWASGRNNISREVYPDLDRFWDDLVAAERSEIKALTDAGCSFIQIDDTTFAKFGDPRVHEMMKERGENWRELIPLYISVMNRVVADQPGHVTIGVHMCRGNSVAHEPGYQRTAGGYDVVAEQLFNELDVPLYYLEYDSERAGSFEPLKHLPKGKVAVLGLVSTKVPEVETTDYLMRRIDEASKFADLSQLAISPQCGFASSFRGHPCNPEQQHAKLARIVEVARRVWGTT